MKSREFFQRMTGYLVMAVVFALLPALMSFLFAAWSAVTTGQVLVVSVGRTNTASEWVPWYVGWSRFACPWVLIAALAAHPSDATPSPVRLLMFVVTAVSGVGMLCASLWFTDWHGVLAFYAFALYVGTAYYVDLVFGRRVAVAFLVGTVVCLLWAYARRT